MILEDRRRAAEGDDYDEALPAAARPQWGAVEKILIISILLIPIACFWLAWGS